MSGTGKSTALAELARRGFRTVDTDEPGWTIEDADRGRWWDEERIAQLLEWGKAPEERAGLILEHIREVEPLLRATCTHEIDTSAPQGEVVDLLVEIAGES